MKSRTVPLIVGRTRLAVRFDPVAAARRESVRIRQRRAGRRRLRRVLMVDPCPSSRAALAEALDRAADVMLCGETDEVSRASKAVERWNPDVVVTEILCEESLAMIRELKWRYPRLPVVVFSFLDEGRYAVEVLEAGADGFLSKFEELERVVEGIRAAAEGRMVLSKGMRARFLARCLAGNKGFEPAGIEETERKGKKFLYKRERR